MKLDRSPDFRPMFDLTRDGALSGLSGEAGIENELFRQLDGLTHILRVAFCYPVRKRHGRAERDPQPGPAWSEPTMESAQGEIRTHTPYGAAPSRRCVYQFHHLGESRERAS